jgi:simple sugar transport system permease protein
MRGIQNWKIEQREDVSLVWRILSVFFALSAAFFISAIVIEVAGASYREAFASLFMGAFGSWHATSETLVKSTPLLLTGLATAIAFKGKIWTIGQEGQLFAGAIGGYWAYVSFQALPRVPLLLIITVAGFLGGAFYGWIPGVLKARFDVDEVISTVMGNYIVAYLLSLLLSGVGPWREPDSFYQQSPTIEGIAQFPILVEKSRLHAGFILAIIMAVIVYIIMQKSPLGYEIRAFGSNPNAVRFKGSNIARLYIAVMAISGGLSGLAGVSEVFGVQHRLRLNLSPGYGFTGIIVAMLAELNPLAIIPSAILFGGLIHGSFRMQVITGVPTAVVNAIQAIVLLFFLTSQVLTKYRLRRVHDGS